MGCLCLQPMGGFGSAGIFPLTAALMPIHPLAFGAFMSWQLLNNILGHAGFEIYPNWLVKKPVPMGFQHTHQPCHAP